MAEKDVEKVKEKLKKRRRIMKEEVNPELLRLVQNIADFAVEAIYEMDEYVGALTEAVAMDKDYNSLHNVWSRLEEIRRRIWEVYHKECKPAISEMNDKYPVNRLATRLKEWYEELGAILGRFNSLTHEIADFAEDGEWDEATETLQGGEAHELIGELWNLHDKIVIHSYCIGAGYITRG